MNDTKPMDKKSLNGSENSIKHANPRKWRLILYIRWMILVSIVFVFLTSPEKTPHTYLFILAYAAAIIFNLIVTYSFKNGEKNKNFTMLIPYIDVVFVSLFSWLTGGTKSEVFIIYSFIIGFSGIFGNVQIITGVSIFSLLLFSVLSIFEAKISLEEMSYMRLIIKDAFIIFSACGMSIVNHEVRKYDELHRKEFKLARTDKLTGLANRHYFDQKLCEEIEFSDLTGSPLNILIFDLDNFKKFNDTYGHTWGDKLLTLFADIIKQNIRKTDIPVRYGGEEFLLLIRGLEEDMAKSVGERIRRQLEKQKIYIDNENERKRVTVSCGVAQYPKHSSNIKEVIDCADKALYHAKEMGKNMVVCYDEIGKVGHNVQMDIDSYLNR